MARSGGILGGLLGALVQGGSSYLHTRNAGEQLGYERKKLEDDRAYQRAQEGRAELRQQQNTQIGLLSPLLSQYPNDAKGITEAQLGIASGQTTLGPQSQPAIPAGPDGMGPWRPQTVSLSELIKGPTAEDLAQKRADEVAQRNARVGLYNLEAGRSTRPGQFAPVLDAAARGVDPNARSSMRANGAGLSVGFSLPSLVDAARQDNPTVDEVNHKQSLERDAQKQAAIVARGEADRQSRSDNAVEAGAGKQYTDAFDRTFNATGDYAQATATATQARQDYLRAAGRRVADVAPVTADQFNQQLGQVRTPGMAAMEQGDARTKQGADSLGLRRELGLGNLNLGRDRYGLSKLIFGETQRRNQATETETGRHNRATEAQGADRNNITRMGQSYRLSPAMKATAADYRDQITRARAMIDKLDIGILTSEDEDTKTKYGARINEINGDIEALQKQLRQAESGGGKTGGGAQLTDRQRYANSLRAAGTAEDQVRKLTAARFGPQ